MGNLLLSAFLGVLIGKVIDVLQKSKKKQKYIYIPMGIVFVVLALIYTLDGKSKAPSRLYIEINKFLLGWDGDILWQSVFLLMILVGITAVNAYGSGFLSFKKYSRKILDFTKRAEERSTITLIAGDMDFLGQIQAGQEKAERLMDDSEEYAQLYQLRDKVKLKILCNNKLEQDDRSAIINNTITSVILYNRFRHRQELGGAAFQQLLRIGKIKNDFGSRVELRFYRCEDDDSKLRARYVDDKGIVYKKEAERTGYRVWNVIRGVVKNPFKMRTCLNDNRYRESLYSINYLNDQEFKYYHEMFNLKWELYDPKECEIITGFCESLYHFVRQDKRKYKMALIYMNSYEIARKKGRRKEFPPFGVLYLAAAVREMQDWEVEIKAIDENNYTLDLTEYDVVGFSIVSTYSYVWLKKCNDTSDMKNDVLKIAGGYQTEKFLNEVFRDFGVDIIFKGEAEDTIKQMCQQYETRNFSDIKGIIYKNSQGELKHNEGRGVVDIDKIPEPARDLLPTEDVVMKNRLAGTERTMVHMLFSRGCPKDCLYCAANQDGNNKHQRYRDKQLIVKELRNLISAYKIEGFSIIDDCFLENKKKAVEICRFIAEQKLGLVWSLAARVDHIDDEVLDALREAGCIEIKFGIETGSNELLDRMGKQVTVETAEEAIRKTKERRIGIKLFIITGLPGETDETHRETMEFLEKMKESNLVDRVSLLRYTPLAGSYIYDHPDKYGINGQKLKTENFDKMHLYKKSYDWWNDKQMFDKRNEWYEELQNMIEQCWGDC